MFGFWWGVGELGHPEGKQVFEEQVHTIHGFPMLAYKSISILDRACILCRPHQEHRDRVYSLCQPHQERRDRVYSLCRPHQEHRDRVYSLCRPHQEHRDRV